MIDASKSPYPSGEAAFYSLETTGPRVLSWGVGCLYDVPKRMMESTSHGNFNRSGQQVPETAERFSGRQMVAPAMVNAATDSPNAPERGGKAA